MNILAPTLRVAIAATALMLAGCAAESVQTQPAMQGSSGAGTMGMGAGMMDADMNKMCRDMHDKMASAKTPEERQAMMQENMKSMTPEMRQRMQERMAAKSCQ
jgi:uncharacterized lipoprotein YajG